MSITATFGVTDQVVLPRLSEQKPVCAEGALQPLVLCGLPAQWLEHDPPERLAALDVSASRRGLGQREVAINHDTQLAAVRDVVE
jgi:hypothetical protein